MKIKRKIIPIREKILLDNDFFLECPDVGLEEYCRLAPKKVVDHSFLIKRGNQFGDYYEELGQDNPERKLHRWYEVNADKEEDFTLLKELLEEGFDLKKGNDEMYTLFTHKPRHEPWSEYQYFLRKMEIPKMWKKSFPPSPSPNENDEYPLIAIIDSGINFTNSELDEQYELVPRNRVKNTHPGYNAILKNFKNHGDEQGHGTFIAGLLSSIKNDDKGQGVIYEYKVLNIKAFSKGKGGNTTSICNAIFFAIKNGASIINCSWGPPFHRDTDKILEDFLDFAFQEKVICVCAAGNQGNDVKGYYPASSSNVITVSASNKDDILMESANFGEGVDVIAPGEAILSLDLNAEGIIRSGTSFAAALISGCIAMILREFPILKYSPDHEDPQVYFTAIKELLQDSALTEIKSYEELNDAARLLNASELLNKAEEKSNSLTPIPLKP